MQGSHLKGVEMVGVKIVHWCDVGPSMKERGEVRLPIIGSNLDALISNMDGPGI